MDYRLLRQSAVPYSQYLLFRVFLAATRIHCKLFIHVSLQCCRLFHFNRAGGRSDLVVIFCHCNREEGSWETDRLARFLAVQQLPHSTGDCEKLREKAEARDGKGGRNVLVEGSATWFPSLDSAGATFEEEEA